MSFTTPSKPEHAAPTSASDARSAPRSNVQHTLWLNGEAVQTAALTLQALLEARGLDPSQRAFVCAVNGEFVPRARWAERALVTDDRIDVVAPVVGG
jgi:sulfur carrier protein